MRTHRWVPVALLFLAAVASAQETGEIGGRVTDTSGAVLPGVTVTLTSPVLLQPAVATTGETGAYRFPRLVIGTYTLTFELAGFSRLLREDIKVEIGFTALVHATLEVSGVEEKVTVSGASPIVDARDSSRGGRFTRDALDRVPNARDPWVVIAQAPAVVNRGRQRRRKRLRKSGDLRRAHVLLLDEPVDARRRGRHDVAANGGSSIYYDFDSFQEMQVTTGGGDATQQSGGVGINMVTRSGTDTFRWSARFLVTDDSLESQNLTNDLRVQGAGAGNTDPEHQGLPASRRADRSSAGVRWIWGAYAARTSKSGVRQLLQEDGACAGLTGSTAIHYPIETVQSACSRT